MQLLDIDRDEFVSNLKLLGKLARKPGRDQALLSFDGKLLYIELGGASVSMAAVGDWPDQIRIAGSHLMALARVPPRQNPVRLLRDRTTLRIESLTIACEAQDSWKSMIDLPVNAGAGDVLALENQYTFEEIMAAGLAETLKDAQRTKSGAYLKALKALAPFGVNAEDLDLALQSALRRREEKL